MLEFFEAENQRDWERYRQFLHPEVIWRLYGAEEKVIRGIENYVTTMQQAYQGTDMRFRCEQMLVSRDDQRIVCYLIDDEGNRSMDIFEFKDSLIYKEYEFLLDEREEL